MNEKRISFKIIKKYFFNKPIKRIYLNNFIKRIY